MVIAPARTGRDNNSKTAVIKTDQTNKGIFIIFIPTGRIFIIVAIKLIAPRMEEIPAMWRLKIARSTAGPVWLRGPESGG